MIIRGEKQTNSIWPYIIGLMILLVFVSAIRFYTPNDYVSSRAVDQQLIYCDAENVEGEYFVNDGQRFTAAETQSSEYAASGKYSSKLDFDHKYGMTYVLNDPIPGARYKAEVWSFNPHPAKGFLVASGPEGSDFYATISTAVEKRDDLWDRRELLFTVPVNQKLDFIKIYVYKDDGDNAIYFDDLKISYLGANAFQVTDEFTPKEMQLVIDKEGMDKLHENKKKSIKQGLVFHDGSKVKAKIWEGDEHKKVSIRHKGDWLDHMGKNPSYRVDMNSAQSWHGMQSFSVQEPSTRGFLREWLFFQFLDHADVIRPRYDFMYFKQNDRDRIIFSYEEHFTKNLVENRNRREGPIVKMTEDRMWETTKRTIEGWNRSLPVIEEKDKAYWTSELKAFKESKMLKNPKLLADFEVAQDLLLQYKYGTTPVKDIFDIDRLAKYLALVDICLAQHAVTWHNQRFYYNPVTALLEPIGFDAYSAEDPQKYASDIYAEKLYTSKPAYKEPIDDLYYDDDFAVKYLFYLDMYSTPSFLQTFLEGLEEQIVVREKFLQQRYKDYKLDREFIKKKARRIQIALPAHVNALQVFQSETEGEMKNLKIINQHNFPLQVMTGLPTSGESQIIYPHIRKNQPKYINWQVPTGTKEVMYKVVGLDSIYTTKINQWTPPDGSITARQSLVESDLSAFDDILQLTDDKVIVGKGEVVISSPMIIPKDKKLYINSGTKIIFEQEGFVLSYGSVHVKGDADDPIVIESRDGKGGSFSVLQAEGRSQLQHVEFKNQNTLMYKNWQLTGGVNFYESDVDVDHTFFYGNQCEDALNIIRSDFTMKNTKFSDTYADAFDSDFCTGDVTDVRFEDIGNDAIDASGSILYIYKVDVSNAGDKGISAGEASTITGSRIGVDSAVIGIASKDKSLVDLKHVILNKCETGFTAYQKKPEFGPAKISLGKHTVNNVVRTYLAEEGSIIDIEKK